jgi:zinc D-Ala-D-Ala carboxypeptidase
MKGQSGDIVIPTVSRYELAVWLQQNLDFDQLILELYTPGQRNSGWVHCSYVEGAPNRKQSLTYPPATHQYISGLHP